MWVDKLRETEKGTYKNGTRIKPETEKWDVFSGDKKPKFLSKNLIGKTRDFLVDIFHGAVDAGIIKKSPVEKVHKEKLPPGKTFWDEETMYQALQEITDSLLHLAVHLTIIGTLRSGEASGILVDIFIFKRVLWKSEK